jgi:hypothetical protein
MPWNTYEWPSILGTPATTWEPDVKVEFNGLRASPEKLTTVRSRIILPKTRHRQIVAA